MSLGQSVTKAINDIIHSFIQQLADKYNLNPNELLNEWEGNYSSKKLTPKKLSITDIPKQTDEINTNDLLNYKKPELQALCRQRGIKCSGTKAQLVGFLLGKNIPSEEKKENNNSKKVISKVSSTPVATKLTSNIKPAAIRINQYGNYEHPETSLVFDKKTKNVIGKQSDDGKIKELTVEDIDTCKQMKFDYVIPNNLDNNKNKDEYVEELDEIIEDEDEDEELEVEDEEEVLLDEEDFIEEDEEDLIEEDEEDE